MQGKRSTSLQSPTRVPPAPAKRNKDGSEENAPRSAGEVQPNRFSRRSLRVRIIMLVYLASYDVPNEILLLVEFFFSAEITCVSLSPYATWT